VLDTDAAFGRKTVPRQLTLVYKITGCTAQPSHDEPLQDPHFPPRLYDPPTGDPIPPGSLKSGGDPDLDVDLQQYIVHLQIAADDVDPGSYGGLVELRAPWMTPVQTPVTVSRSEDNMLVPMVWGAIGALAGFALFAILGWFKRQKLALSVMQVIIAAAVAVVVGAIAAYLTNYKAQSVWTSSENWSGAAGVGLTASTSGVMTALLAAFWKTAPPGED
jgi:uncharacterized membrane protein YeaQ/YmgE (transglycosylase-associated protein family)